METIKRFELKKIQTNFPAVSVSSSLDSYNFIKQFYGDDIEVFESFYILCLDQSSKTTGYAKISQGGISGTLIDIRLIAKYAVENLSSGVILAHNHPSGQLKPSNADMDLTEKVVGGLGLLRIRVLDHIILTKDGYYSFLDEGIL